VQEWGETACESGSEGESKDESEGCLAAKLARLRAPASFLLHRLFPAPQRDDTKFRDAYAVVAQRLCVVEDHARKHQALLARRYLVDGLDPDFWVASRLTWRSLERAGLKTLLRCPKEADREHFLSR
jgi:hypothetical protein